MNGIDSNTIVIAGIEDNYLTDLIIEKIKSAHTGFTFDEFFKQILPISTLQLYSEDDIKKEMIRLADLSILEKTLIYSSEKKKYVYYFKRKHYIERTHTFSEKNNHESNFTIRQDSLSQSNPRISLDGNQKPIENNRIVYCKLDRSYIKESLCNEIQKAIAGEIKPTDQTEDYCEIKDCTMICGKCENHI